MYPPPHEILRKESSEAMAEEGKVSVTLIKPTTVAGEVHERGESVEVYPIEVWGMVQGGYVSSEEAEGLGLVEQKDAHDLQDDAGDTEREQEAQARQDAAERDEQAAQETQEEESQPQSQEAPQTQQTSTTSGGRRQRRSGTSGSSS